MCLGHEGDEGFLGPAVFLAIGGYRLVLAARGPGAVKQRAGVGNDGADGYGSRFIAHGGE
jgi:hypothetical protein